MSMWLSLGEKTGERMGFQSENKAQIEYNASTAIPEGKNALFLLTTRILVLLVP